MSKDRLILIDNEDAMSPSLRDKDGYNGFRGVTNPMWEKKATDSRPIGSDRSVDENGFTVEQQERLTKIQERLGVKVNYNNVHRLRPTA